MVYILFTTGRQCEDGGEVSNQEPRRRNAVPDHDTPDLCGQCWEKRNLGK